MIDILYINHFMLILIKFIINVNTSVNQMKTYFQPLVCFRFISKKDKNWSQKQCL